jgi:hypothetical protein
MTPKFMRQEAARFRDMASMTEREASRLRLLAMADDYEARATAIDGVAAPKEPVAEVEEAPEPQPAETTTKLRLGRRSTKSQAGAV